jgi:hypothetical protein
MTDKRTLEQQAADALTALSEELGLYDPPGYDATLLSLARHALSFTGHIEDMSEDQRVFLLGAFAGAVLRFQEQVVALHASAGGLGDAEAARALQEVLNLLGEAG